ncbi:phytase [Sphingobium phenoxybenzoativorans]|uniref:phytase n=1 Tax=Sphingobium phenoxybenzoativorans TaxID=1592790 RepID=UPI000871FFDC|nr:phytase [Sphingobium phenoxybenzoativorans]
MAGIGRLEVAARYAGALLACLCAAPSFSAAPVMEPTATVAAQRETQKVGQAGVDTADDPAIWRNPADPEASLVLGTDKEVGLYVYGMDGKVRHFVAGKLNNVDLRDGIMIDGKPGILVVASDRQDKKHARLQLFRLDTATSTLIPVGSVDAGEGQGYGLCLYRRGDAADAFMISREGMIRHIRLDVGGATVSGAIVRSFAKGSRSEGCIADERTGTVYMAQEHVGLWRFEADADKPLSPTLIASTDKTRLVKHLEGMAIAPQGKDAGHLVVASQGSDAFVVYRLPDLAYAGRFQVGGSGAIEGVQHTDGIDLALGDFGPDFPAGLFVTQDGESGDKVQNFKLVSWAKILEALKIDR